MKHQFQWYDYATFFGLLAVSALVGVYHALMSKQASVEEYMLGGRKMPLLPVALSLIASFISGITLLGIPSETYLYGTQMLGICVAIVISAIILNIFYLPVLYGLEFKSLYEYLERRFDRRVRLLTSFVFALAILSNIPVVIYVPALAFNQVTGVSVHALAPLICAVCIFYTSVGGLKAVVWSDAIQSGFTLFSMGSVLVLGIISVGGLGKVFEINDKGERLEFFNFDPDPFKRNTFWTTALGSIPLWLNILACHPSTVQRYVSLPSFKMARMVTLLMVIGIIFLKVLSTATGLLMYTAYEGCDPLHSKEIQHADQILPYYIMEVGEKFPGLAGIFLSGVVSSALSSMSTGLNTLSGTLYEDFLRGRLPWKQTDKAANLTMKIIVVVLGVLTTLGVFVVEKLGTVMQVAVSLSGVTTGVQLNAFTLGMFCPWANAKGALSGIVVGTVTTAWLMIGAQLQAQTGDIKYHTKVLSVQNCSTYLGFNTTIFGQPGYGTKVEYSDNVQDFFRISFLYYALVSFATSLTVGCVVSLITKEKNRKELDPRLLIPQIRGFFQPRQTEKDTP